ncbi:MAG: ribonuclease PH [Oligoflexia bacterium]|nr:ribonuclease PH [Oligoflexia bacterium]
MRAEERSYNELRPVSIQTQVNCWAEGSAQISMGKTKVLCTASVSETTPQWLNKPGHGWLTAEYAMLPRSGDFRVNRERAFNSGRSQEISRLIGRSLRAGVDLSKLGERQIYIDCDVLQADGGTRTASITGGFIALALALKNLKDQYIIKNIPLKNYVCAVSVGLNNSQLYVDLDSKEDKSCETDMNFVMNDQSNFIEIQGTAEKQSFTKDQMLEMMNLAHKAGLALIQKQKELVGGFFPKS